MMRSVTDQQAFANYQYEIYLAGAGDQRPELPHFAPAAWERAFAERVTPEAHGSVAGAAGAEDTLRENLEAFRRWRIVPRMLRDISVRDMRVDLFGTELHSPVLLAPVGVQQIVHPEGELASALEEASLGVPMVHSTAASISEEDVAEPFSDTPRWFQLYWPNDQELTASLVERDKWRGYITKAL